MTGRYPIHTGLNNGPIPRMTPYGLEEKFTVLPEELKRYANLITTPVINFCYFQGWICHPYHWKMASRIMQQKVLASE